MNTGPGRTYRYFTGTPLYPFGWGLSYTTFNLTWASPPSMSPLANTGGSSSVYSILVTNTGTVTGDEVVLAFFSTTAVPSSDPASAIIRQLFDFQRVTLEPGQATTVSFTVDPTSTFILYDVDGNQVSYPGNYEVQFTDGVAQTLSTPVVVSGDYRIIDSFV